MNITVPKTSNNTNFVRFDFCPLFRRLAIELPTISCGSFAAEFIRPPDPPLCFVLFPRRGWFDVEGEDVMEDHRVFFFISSGPGSDLLRCVLSVLLLFGIDF